MIATTSYLKKNVAVKCYQNEIEGKPTSCKVRSNRYKYNSKSKSSSLLIHLALNALNTASAEQLPSFLILPATKPSIENLVKNRSKSFVFPPPEKSNITIDKKAPSERSNIENIDIIRTTSILDSPQENSDRTPDKNPLSKQPAYYEVPEQPRKKLLNEFRKIDTNSQKTFRTFRHRKLIITDRLRASLDVEENPGPGLAAMDVGLNTMPHGQFGTFDIKGSRQALHRRFSHVELIN